MSSIRKRGNRWQAQVRREGQQGLSKTFHMREDALRWAREQERLIERGQFIPSMAERVRLKLADLLFRYRDEVLPTKRSGASEHFHIRQILRHPIAQLALSQLSPVSIVSFRDYRLSKVSASTVRREMGILMHALRMARSEWGLIVPELGLISKPPANKPRERRLTDEEIKALDAALRSCRNRFVRPTFLFALATGMRRGEVLSLRWENIDFDTKPAFLPITKNGYARTVPLSTQALSVLDGLSSAGLMDAGLVFPISPNALRLAWDRVRLRAKVEDLRFHDLRHEAISRFFELGLSVPEVALISGHKDARMLFRYTHMKAEKVAEKLRGLE